MSDKSNQNILWLLFSVALVLFAASTLVVTINLGSSIIASWMAVIFQILLAIITVVVVALIVIFIWAQIANLHSSIVSKIENLQEKHAELLKKVNKRKPTFAAATLLLASLVMLFVDKTFNQKVPAICISVVLLVLFWISNELLVADSRQKKIAGGFLWSVGLLFLPGTLLLKNNFSINKIMILFSTFGYFNIMLMALTFLVACSAPFVINRNS